MRVFRQIADFVAEAESVAPSGTVVAIGNFDGIHPGHRAVIGAARAEADRRGLPLLVLTFDPHPRRYFNPDGPNFILTPLNTKIRLIADASVDCLVVARFDETFAKLEAEAFVDDVLVGALRARHVTTGEGFRFGRQRRGDGGLLSERLAPVDGIYAPIAAVSGLDGEPCSSSRIRALLRVGHPDEAAVLLGRYWEITGTVQRGDQLGRELGFPTANIDLGAHLRPASGIYAVRILLPGDGAGWRDAVASLGTRPTVGGKDLRFEVYIFDFDAEIYGLEPRVQIVARLRGEEHYDSLDALKEQIVRDCADARAILAKGPPPGMRGLSAS